MIFVVGDKVVVAHGRPVPGRRLSQELIDVILEDLHDHKDALSKCCLVHSRILRYAKSGICIVNA
ncbi:hypothetical protein PHLGIDRAFT_252868 [Phlebiopsis gigantea 11061_1 CR5-6]|uniref:Uncharacterized protein n=1 Tax=Phlebiopsis gigantea (strain 11061_1 CR5-6) TaxID=745531 RepID=A0A0C3RS84_PHLG1|nr:hypothetical protein PHLGIDRAFT_252868 [Phlebiopsis gigantea 11061_1 CR5-6]